MSERGRGAGWLSSWQWGQGGQRGLNGVGGRVSSKSPLAISVILASWVDLS